MSQFDELPEGWDRVRIGDVVELKYGKGLTKDKRDGGEFPVYGSNGVVGYHSNFLVKESSLIIGRKGSIGEVSISETSSWPIDTTYFINEFYGQPIKFWFYRLNSLSLKEMDRASAIPGLNREDVYKQNIPLPPVNEQRRIVEKIEALTARSRKARAALDQIPALLDQFRQSVLAAAFRGDLTADWRAQNPNVEPADALLERIRVERRKRWEEAELEKMEAKGKEPKNNKWKEKYETQEEVNLPNLPQIPNSWCWVRWQEVGLCQNGRAFPSQEYSTQGTKLLRPGNLHMSGAIEWTDSNTKFMPDDWAEKYPSYIIYENELVINLTAQSLADEFLGRVCLSGKRETCLLNQRIARLTPIVISNKFCLWLFKSPVFRQFVDTLNTGSLIQHMFVSQVDEFFFPLPPLAEQAEIVRVIENQLVKMRKLRDLADQSFEELPQLDQSILAKAFRGELVPQDPNDEPAAVLLDRIRAERERLSSGKKRGKAKA